MPDTPRPDAAPERAYPTSLPAHLRAAWDSLSDEWTTVLSLPMWLLSDYAELVALHYAEVDRQASLPDAYRRAPRPSTSTEPMNEQYGLSAEEDVQARDDEARNAAMLDKPTQASVTLAEMIKAVETAAQWAREFPYEPALDDSLSAAAATLRDVDEVAAGASAAAKFIEEVASAFHGKTDTTKAFRYAALLRRLSERANNTTS